MRPVNTFTNIHSYGTFCLPSQQAQSHPRECERSSAKHYRATAGVRTDFPAESDPSSSLSRQSPCPSRPRVVAHKGCCFSVRRTPHEEKCVALCDGRCLLKMLSPRVQEEEAPEGRKLPTESWEVERTLARPFFYKGGDSLPALTSAQKLSGMERSCKIGLEKCPSSSLQQEHVS